MLLFSGHFFWTLDSYMVPGPAQGITQVWGVPSPIDTVFTRCNCQGKTYIFKVNLLIWYETNESIWQTWIWRISWIRPSRHFFALGSALISHLFAWGLMFLVVIFAGIAVLEIWKWCFGPQLSEGGWNRLWWTPGSDHSCSVCASVPEEERGGVLLQERWWTDY